MRRVPLQPERMETDEEDGNEKRALLPKAAPREDDVASRVGPYIAY